jgi:pyruvate-formate lyase-activating enzyme
MTGAAASDPRERFVHGGVAEVKLTARCDQRCVFCKSPADAANRLDPEAALALFPGLAERARLLTLSGGEATLVPELEQVVSGARAAGFRRVELQTNGMALDRPGLAESLRAAGLTNVLVSLHAHQPGLSDRLTGTPGGFARTLAGIDRAADAGLQISLCHVICQGNVSHLEAFADHVRARFAGRPLQVVFTLAIPTYRVRQEPGLMPSLDQVGPPLRAALDRFVPARAPLSSRLGGAGWALARSRAALASREGPVGRLARRVGHLSTPPERWRRRHRARIIAHCGLPVCVLDSRAPFHDEWWWRDPAPAVDELTHPPACEPCRRRERCSGLWRVYVERFDSDGLSPMAG